MTKISLILWAMNFMYGLGCIFLAFGIIAALGFCVFAIIAFISHLEDPDDEESSAFRKAAKYCAIASVSCFLLVSAIPPKSTCYTFIVGELMDTQQAKKLNSDAIQFFEDVKTIIHKYAEDNK